MLNRTADEYYSRIGHPNPSCEQRTDPRLSVKAQIAWMKREWFKYWDEFTSSGKTKVAGRTITATAFSGSGPFYTGLSKAEFLYGLIHHDGVGNAQNGIDKGGVRYWRSRMS